jgi:[ribosomal protein S18]-alanine N-acetyltransferase
MSSVRFRVRVAGAADLDGIVTLERAIPEAPHWAAVQYGAIVNADEDAGGAVRRCLFVAETQGWLLGFSVGKIIDSGVEKVAELESLAVKATERRTGVGRALCAAVVDWCRGQQVRVLELEVRAGSIGAIALYTGLGFAVAGRRRGYYENPAEDAVMMRLELVKGT